MPEDPSSTGRLIVVSNRLPKGDTIPAGGLVYALDAALRAEGGLWIGAGETAAEASDTLTRIGPGTAYERATFTMTDAEYQGYYLGYANAVLWPLFHHRPDLLEVNEGDFAAYCEVNKRVARAIRDVIGPEDLIWVQDYHFLMVAHELRALGVSNRIGLFLHIPFPSPHDIMALPQVAMVPAWLAAHDVVGLQTHRDVASAQEVMRYDEKAHHLADGSWIRDGRVFSIDAFPIGIDAAGFHAAAEAAPEPSLQLAPKAPLLVGADRLDYSKGLVHRFEAFGEYLGRLTPGNPRPTFLQIAPPSREDVAAYREIREELERTAGSLNGAHADLDWTPIRYVRRHVDREEIAGLLRRADVGLVTPLADGMNLVAKEFVAAQDPKDPGVLVLSHFAGAAEQMEDALLINPFDRHSFADAIGTALEMPLQERRARHAALSEAVFEKDIAWWTSSFLGRLRAAPRSVETYLKAI